MEIKPQDLRVGNLVIANGLHEGKIMTVEGIDRQGTMSPESRVIIFKEHHVGEFIKDIKGIELTPEWLTRLGWVWNPECNSWEKYPNGDARMHLKFHDVSFSYTMFNYVLRATIAERIHYVHQLQNLFLSLTGEELAIDKTSLI